MPFTGVRSKLPPGALTAHFAAVRGHLYDQRLTGPEEATAAVARNIGKSTLQYRKDMYGLPEDADLSKHFEIYPGVYHTSSNLGNPYSVLQWGVRVNGKPAGSVDQKNRYDRATGEITRVHHRYLPYFHMNEEYDPAVHGEPQPPKTAARDYRANPVTGLPPIIERRSDGRVITESKPIWHLTRRKDFRPSTGVRPVTNQGMDRATGPALFGTTSPHYWAEIAGGFMGKAWAQGRKWAAELDVSGHPPVPTEHPQQPESYLDPAKVTVKRIIPVEHAIAETTGYLGEKYVGHYRYPGPDFPGKQAAVIPAHRFVRNSPTPGDPYRCTHPQCAEEWGPGQDQPTSRCPAPESTADIMQRKREQEMKLQQLQQANGESEDDQVGGGTEEDGEPEEEPGAKSSPAGHTAMISSLGNLIDAGAWNEPRREAERRA